MRRMVKFNLASDRDAKALHSVAASTTKVSACLQLPAGTKLLSSEEPQTTIVEPQEPAPTTSSAVDAQTDFLLPEYPNQPKHSFQSRLLANRNEHFLHHGTVSILGFK